MIPIFSSKLEDILLYIVLQTSIRRALANPLIHLDARLPLTPAVPPSTFTIPASPSAPAPATSSMNYPRENVSGAVVWDRVKIGGYQIETQAPGSSNTSISP